MSDNAPQKPDDGGEQKERYTPGYGPGAELMALRTASLQARFFTPHLEQGMNLLDCGCGPGTITVGLADTIAPGRVTGIDIGESQIERAQAHAAEKGVLNIEFQVANIYELPFPDNAFDAVFINGVLEHIGEPIKALKEAHRVLKLGGVVGVRSSFHGTEIISPDISPLQERIFSIYEAILKHNGGSHRVGRRLRALAHEAGFANLVASATYDYFGTLEETRIVGTQMAGFPFPAQQAIDMGLATSSELEEMAAAWRDWGEHPNAFIARGFGEVVGWKQ